MGRRSVHTSEELREIILEAATEIIRQSGYSALSARAIARRIDYSPGTLYNVFENLGEVVLTIEGRLIDRLIEHLDGRQIDGSPLDRVHGFATSYLAFIKEEPKLWGLLLEHHLPDGQAAPAWYQQKLEQLMLRVEGVLSPLVSDEDPEKLRCSARVFWGGVLGIISIATSDKLAGLNSVSASDLMRDLVSTYVGSI